MIGKFHLARRLPLVGAAFWLAGSFPVSAPAQDGDDGSYSLDEWLRRGVAVAQTLNEQYEVDWEQVGRWMSGALQGESWQSLVDVNGTAEQLYTLLKSIPGASAQADWLRQRMDYIDMAAWVMQPEAASAPVRLPTACLAKVWPTPTPRIGPMPTACPVPTRAPVKKTETQQRKEKAVASTGLWKKTLAKRAMPERAAVLAPRLKTVFLEEGIPPELVWLAEVESSMNPQARSPVGAAGLFQFMPATAERFGLRVEPEDERLDPEKSARAAAKYLRLLYKQFNDWPLSLAAYNAGEGRVGRVLREQKASCFEEIAEHLPLETRMYVPKIMAVIALRERNTPSTLPPPS